MCCKYPHSNSHIKAKLESNSMKIILKDANQHLTVTVLLEYVDLFTSCMNIMLGIYHSVVFMLNALTSLKNIGCNSTNHTSLC